MIKQFYYCSCYYTHNLYVKSVDKHFTFNNEMQFHNDYDKVLDDLGCNTFHKECIIQEIMSEINRRKLVHEKAVTTRKFIEANYISSDTSVYLLKDDFFEPSFLDLVKASKEMNFRKVFQMIQKVSLEKKIYRFPVFKTDFCLKFLKELNNFENSDLPKERPNTMNNNGVLIDDIGFNDGFSVPLREEYLYPLAKILFPEWTGQCLDSHKIFTVGYKSGQDIELGYHYDNSEVTLNVCLGKKFKNGNLYFGDMNTIPVSQSTCILVPNKVGYGVLHRGQQYHGALPITHGERQNLILWMRSSSIRNSLCPMCGLKPSLIEAEDYGDGFTNNKSILT